MCVCVSPTITTAQACNLACTDTLMNSDRTPKIRSFWPTLRVKIACGRNCGSFSPCVLTTSACTKRLLCHLMQVISKLNAYVIFSAYCACASYELLTKWRIFLLTSLTKCLLQQVHFTVKSASTYVSARGLNGPLSVSKHFMPAERHRLLVVIRWDKIMSEDKPQDL